MASTTENLTSQARSDTHPRSSHTDRQTFRPQHVHFVGSIPLSSNTEVFHSLSTTLPGRLLRIPDGETGKRGGFVGWQREIFAATPHIIRPKSAVGSNTTIDEIPNTAITLKAPGYDEFALESYAEFCKLREEGVIEKGVRFQVSLPTPLNVIASVIRPNYQADAEPLYENALLKALRRIQHDIPAEDLAIQWDLALEIAMLETPPIAQPWFSPLREGIMERLNRLLEAVDQGVQVGFHLCYGDFQHKHFVEPKDMGLLVEIGNMILDTSVRSVNWIHMPVPKDRMDGAYFMPLVDLRLTSETELMLGLVHGWDVEGTKKRIEAARHFAECFGIATECGFGRTTIEELESVLEIMVAVTGRSGI
jgi:methionine synthase II (cobalamin-independent)